MKRILIVRLGAMGDIVHAVPVAAALRRAWPDARIDWLVDAKHRPLLELVPVIDRRLTLAGGVLARTMGTAGIVAIVSELRRGRYDAALDLQGLIKSAVLARSSGAARVIGCASPHLREPLARWFYTETYSPPAARHVIEKNLAVLPRLGVHDAAIGFPFEAPPSTVPDEIRERLELGPDRPFAVINPGAAWPNKRWPAERFGLVAQELFGRYGLKSAVLWGPGEERLANEVAERASGAAAAAPPTSIGDLFALSKAASLLLSGDTGPLHIACAVGTPVIGIYGPTNPARNGPWSELDVTVSRFESCVCHHLRRCRRATECLLDIGVGEVLSAIDRRLGQADEDPPATTGAPR